MAAPPTEHEILDVNRRYHDVAAGSYDAKWGISFGEIGHQQVLGKLTKLLGDPPGPFAHSLEIGAGTGYFSLNLVTDLSALPTHKPAAQTMLGALEFNAGRRYADYDEKTDHTAEYGLAALVVGVAAKKLGFFALAAVFFAKFAKFIILGLALAGGAALKLFKRRSAT